MDFDFINIAHAGVITDAPRLSTVGINVLNFLLSVFGIVAIMALVVSGVVYFFSVGNEKLNERAKRGATYATVGVTLVLGGMVIVRMIAKFFE